MRIPSYMQEVHAHQLKAKTANRILSAKPTLGSMMMSPQSLGYSKITVAIKLFMKSRGMHPAMAPTIEKRTFELGDYLWNWHEWLKEISLNHSGWTDRAEDPRIEFDDDDDRFILVGEHPGKGDPVTSKIGKDDGGTVREFFEYAFPQLPVDPAPQARRQSGGKGNAKALPQMRTLAIVIPVKETLPLEEQQEEIRIKREAVSQSIPILC
jgi:hypothetical protein